MHDAGEEDDAIDSLGEPVSNADRRKRSLHRAVAHASLIRQAGTEQDECLRFGCDGCIGFNACDGTAGHNATWRTGYSRWPCSWDFNMPLPGAPSARAGSGDLIKNEPSVLGDDGIYQDDEMRMQRVTRVEVLPALRQQGHAA